MRKSAVISLTFLMLFLLSLPNNGVITTEEIPSSSSSSDSSGMELSDYPDGYTGTGKYLPVTLSGAVENVYDGSFTISSSSTGTTTVGLSSGWTGTDLVTTIEGMSVWRNNDLKNGYLNAYHTEKFPVSGVTESSTSVNIPDSWTLTKQASSGSTRDRYHPNHGIWRFQSVTGGGYSGTMGWRFRATWSAGNTLAATDEVYLGQQVSAPYREIYSARVTLQYMIPSTPASNMNNQVHLIVRLGGYETKLYVFESGDPVNSWTQQTVDIPYTYLSTLTMPNSLLLEIGLATDRSGSQTLAENAYVLVDNIDVSMEVRPFPEQIGLKANGVSVVGSTLDVMYDYISDNAGGTSYDCYDDSSTGVDLDGYNNDGILSVGAWGSSWSDVATTKFEAGLQFALDIPQGAAIVQAYLEVYPHATQDTPAMRIRAAGKTTGGAAVTAFTTGLPALESRYSWVKTGVDWTPSRWLTEGNASYYGYQIVQRSPDFTGLVQAVVSDSTWSTGNLICLMLEYMNSAGYQTYNDFRGTYSYTSPEVARLMVEYLVPLPADQVYSFLHEKDLTIDHTRVDSDLANFPVLIDMTDTDLRDDAQADADDIAFSIGGVGIDYEIEYYNSGTGRLVAWVKVPSLSSTTDTVITMHYGNPYAQRGMSRSVWSDYSYIGHMHTSPAGTVYDSASGNYHGTSYGAMDASDLVSAKIDSGIDFDGANDRISVGQIYTNDWTQFTVSAWVYHDTSADDRVFTKSFSTDPSSHIMSTQVSGTTYRVRLWTDGTGAVGASHDFGTVTPGAWHLMTWSWSASTAQIVAYLDGSQLGAAQAHDGDTIRDSVEMFVIGDNSLATNSAAQRFWDGRIDEVRLTKSVLSSSWVLTEYRNQNSPSTFMSVGVERDNPVVWSDNDVASIVFRTSSVNPVSMDVVVTMDISGTGKSLDEDYQDGTTFTVANASIVDWTAKILVSPPSATTNLQVDVPYPQQDWRPVSLTNPIGQLKTYPTEWYYEGGVITIPDATMDAFGVWTLKFVSMNYISDSLLGPDGGPYTKTANFTSGLIRFQAVAPQVTGAIQGLSVTDPDGVVRFTSSTTPASAPTFDLPSFRYRKTITILNTRVQADLINFPVLVDILDTHLHDSTRAQSDGDDIVFVQNGKVLAHEVELWTQNYDATRARLVAWVRANLSDTVDTVITMYYGNPVVGPQTSPKAVWSSSYGAVWHLDELTVDEQTTGIHYDSTAGAYIGNQNGNVRVTDKIVYSQEYDGTNDWISVASTEGLNPSDDVSLSGWFYLPSSFSSSSTASYTIMTKYLNADYNMHLLLVGTDYVQATVGKSSLVLKVETLSGSTRYTYTSKNLWAAGWYHYTAMVDISDMTQNAIYINGAAETVLTAGSATTGSVAYSGQWGLGGKYLDTFNMPDGDAFLNGRMDEVRVSGAKRTAGWISTEYNSQNSPATFYNVGSEQTRTDLTPSFARTVGATDAAGVWTVSIYYNDTSSGVDYRTGLYERHFIVKRATTLTLNAPEDAVPDGISARIAGELLYIEVQLRDTGNSEAVTGAVVKMNWTASGTPTTKTLNSYGTGKYGLTLDTDDLATNTRWRINIWSTHDYYVGASKYFDLDLSHDTDLTYAWVSTTPVGFDFTASLYFRDAYTSSPVTGATIRFANGTAVNVVAQSNGWYNISLSTSGLNFGDHSYTFVASKASAYLETANVGVTFTLRHHYTALSASGDFITPYAFDTSVQVSIIDLDTGTLVPVASVDSILFTWSGGSRSVDPVTTYAITLTTSTWSVGTVAVTLTATMTTNYYTPDAYIFSIQVRKHYTSVTVTGSLVYPYGNNTPVTVKITDLDTGSILAASTVSSLSFTWSGGSYNPTGPYSTLSFVLPTSTWPVGVRTVTLAVTMGTVYNNPSNYAFGVTITSMDTVLYIEPTDLLFPRYDDFVVVLRVDVSERGTYFGTPVTGLTQAQFSVTTYPIESLTDLGSGRYQLRIDQSNFAQGTYTITVTVSPTDNRYASSSLVIVFQYRPAESMLSSPNYPLVITPINIDVVITLNYTDLDRRAGITTAVISAIGITIYNQQNLGSGIYHITIDLAGLSVGEHTFSLTATASGYVAKTLQFQLRVRVAYTYAIPTTGALDIPVGNDPVFYVQYWDTDNDVPVTGATITCTWSKYTAAYVPAEQRYRVTFQTDTTDTLVSNMVVTFNFSKGADYQPGVFTLSVTIRTHRTDFRLVSAVEPTAYNGMIEIDVYYGDLDNNVGINSTYIYYYVTNASGLVSSSLVYGTQVGYFTVRVAASQFGGLGVQVLTVHFEWTGLVQTYENRTAVASANIIGEDSRYTLITASEPTPYLDNMSYVFLYESLAGTGITNATGNVQINVLFQGKTVNLALVTIWEVDRSGNPGRYAIEFDTEIFGEVGLIYMTIFINWTIGVSPFYTNRMDTVSVRILSRDTLASIVPPTPTPHGENATFSFTFDDVTGGSSVPIAYDAAHMFITISLGDFSLIYNATTQEFTVSFDTDQSPVGDAPLGQKSFTLSIVWTGEPFYANRTGRTIYVSVTARQTVLDYQSPAPTQYGDTVTFTVTWTDVTSSPQGIDTATVTLYNGASQIPLAYYDVTPTGLGQYDIELDTSYYSAPAVYKLKVVVSTVEFYIASVPATREFNVRYRVTLVSSEPTASVPYTSPVDVILYYQDLFTLANIGNGTSKVTLTVLNGTSWTYTIEWKPAFGYYLLTIDTYNQPLLEINRVYVLHLNMSYAYESPFYRWDDTYVSFELRVRISSLELETAPLPGAYLDYITFAVFYRDIDADSGIGGAVISLYKGATELVAGTQYTATQGGAGHWTISVLSTALNGLGDTYVTVYANRSGTPFNADATLAVKLTVTYRPTSVEILSAPPVTRYDDNIVIVFAYVDLGTATYVGSILDKIVVYNNGTLVLPAQYSLAAGTLPNTVQLTIDSSVLSGTPVSRLPLGIKVDWPSSTPYYADSTTTLPVTISGRVGVLTWDPILSTPIGDMMDVVFYYDDADTGAGIAGAVVVFDCVQKPGLQLGTDYTIAQAGGTYTISVDTDRLVGVSTYTFTLGVHWDSGVAPFYSNQTTKTLYGIARIIAAALDAGLPSPQTVPYFDNVSFDVTFTDQDHLAPINGVLKANVSIKYKSTMLEPAVWYFQALGGGVYRITVDTSDAGFVGVRTLVIDIDSYPYSAVQKQVSFQIRYRIGLISLVSMPSGIYAGDPITVFINITDADSAGAPVSGADVVLTWAVPGGTALDVGGGNYQIGLSTAGLVPGLKQLTVAATETGFTITTVVFAIDLKAITTELVLAGNYGQPIYWGESLTVYAFYNDTVHDVGIDTAGLTFTWSGLPWMQLTDFGGAGNYSASLDTRNVAATTMVVTIRAEKGNFLPATASFIMSILPRPVTISPVGSPTQSIPRGSSAPILVYLADSATTVPLNGSVLTASWNFEGYVGSVILTDLGGGYYESLVDTTSTRADGTYQVIVTSVLQNYQTASTSFQLYITQTATWVLLDDTTVGYEFRSFNWSEVVRIGVYVLALDLGENDSDYAQWDSRVRLVYENIDLTMIAFGTTGWFYFDFNTTDYSIGTYTFRVVATPNNASFAQSANRTVITVLRVSTDVDSPPDVSPVWGVTQWYNFTYNDLLRSLPIANDSYGLPVTATYSWAGYIGDARYFGNGVYGVFINTSLLSAGSTYAVTMAFDKPNFQLGSGRFDVQVRPVPTEIVVISPDQNLVDTNPRVLVVPIGDSVTILFLYNDTYYSRGLDDATLGDDTKISGPGLDIPWTRNNFTLEPLGAGLYRLVFDTNNPAFARISSDAFRITIELELSNRVAALVLVQVTVIRIPTQLVIVDAISGWSLMNGETQRVRLFYNDTWHNTGVEGASFNVTSSSTGVFTVTSGELGGGYYYIDIATGGIRLSDSSATMNVAIGYENHVVQPLSVVISVHQGSTDLLVTQGLQYGLPISLVVILLLVGYVKVWSVPKRIRQINGQIKTISKGKIPKPISDAKSRQQLIADLFNDTYSEVSIARSAEQMPLESITVDIPEMGELLIQLSMLTHLGPEELDDFKADISKMRLSEQATFVKEVIMQEALRAARRDNKTVEQVLEQTRSEAKNRLSGEKGPAAVAEAPEAEAEEEESLILERETRKRIEPARIEPKISPKAAQEFEALASSSEKLSALEVEELRKDLEARGIPRHEIDIIMDQAKELPRELVEDLVRSISKKG